MVVVMTCMISPSYAHQMIFTYTEYNEVVNTGIPSYVVDPCGCMYALYPNASNAIDYKKIK